LWGEFVGTPDEFARVSDRCNSIAPRLCSDVGMSPQHGRTHMTHHIKHGALGSVGFGQSALAMTWCGPASPCPPSCTSWDIHRFVRSSQCGHLSLSSPAPPHPRPLVSHPVGGSAAGLPSGCLCRRPYHPAPTAAQFCHRDDPRRNRKIWWRF